MVAGEVHPRLGHQRGQVRQTIQRLEHNVCGSVVVRRFGLITHFASIVLTPFLVFGVSFEVPVAVVVLARLGIVSIEQLKQYRSYYIVGAAIVSAVVTPPDVISQLSLLGPLIVLYELGIIAARIFIKHTKAADAGSETAK